MALVRDLGGQFFEVDASALEGKEVKLEDIKDLPPSLPPPPEPAEGEGDVEGHWPHCGWHDHHHHWYNWHNHHWHNHHHH